MDGALAGISLKTLNDTLARQPRERGHPKYAHLCDAFRECIRVEAFNPGDHVPSETDLATALPVGLGTVQRALSRLAADGVITRRRKLGTFIADARHQVPEVHVYRFRDAGTGQLRLPFTRVLGVDLVPTGEARIPSATLDGFKCDEVLRIDRKLWIEGEPWAFNSLYLHPDHGRHLLELERHTLDGASLHRVLTREFQLPTLSVRHCAVAQALSDPACRTIGVEPPHVGLVWDVRDFSFDDRLVMVQRFELPQGHRPMEIDECKGRARQGGFEQQGEDR